MTELKLNNDTPITDEGVLNRQWHKWNMVVKEAANKFIPTSKSAPQKFHTFNLKATKLYWALKIANKIKRLTLTDPTPRSLAAIVEDINKKNEAN